jgi:hypothetical protein
MIYEIDAHPGEASRSLPVVLLPRLAAGMVN